MRGDTGSSPVLISRSVQSTDSVLHTNVMVVIAVGERTLSYRKNDRASQPDLVRTNDYS